MEEHVHILFSLLYFKIGYKKKSHRFFLPFSPGGFQFHFLSYILIVLTKFLIATCNYLLDMFPHLGKSKVVLTDLSQCSQIYLEEMNKLI